MPSVASSMTSDWVLEMSTVTTPPSFSGSSKVASCDASMSGFMKWPFRSEMRFCSSSGDPLQYTNAVRSFGYRISIILRCVLTSGSSTIPAVPLRTFRYFFFNAEHAITTAGRPMPPSSVDVTLSFSNSSLHFWIPVRRIAWSHGKRSSSVRGWPADILSTLDCG